jgi:hypothetical protein
MLGILFFSGLAMLLLFFKQPVSQRKAGLGAWTMATISILLVIGLIYEGTCAYNFRSHGYNGISAIDSSEFKKFYFCLQSVGEPTGKPYFPIDQDRRELIARAGPNAKWFMAEMNQSSYLKQVGLEHFGSADIASGWLEFAIFNVAYRASDGNLQKCYSLFDTIEKEIADADRRGILKVRPIVPLPDSRVSLVAEAYPGALLTTINEVAWEPPASALAWNTALGYDNPDFTTALHRRVIQESPVRDRIWTLLCGVYDWLYTPLVVYFYLIVWLVYLTLILIWPQMETLSPGWIAQQLFGFFFLIWIAWYAIFDASGWPALSRYMIFNHVLLPILLIYYLISTVRLLRKGTL